MEDTVNHSTSGRTICCCRFLTAPLGFVLDIFFTGSAKTKERILRMKYPNRHTSSLKVICGGV
jgi:hypothetical protein